MNVKSLIPWNRSSTSPVNQTLDEGGTFLTLHREMNRLFDTFFRDIELPTGRFQWTGGWPKLDVKDGGEEVKVIAELPGLDQKDVEVTLREGVLTVRGEKMSENDGTSYSERWHGQFERSIHLGPDIDPDKVSAKFKNGLLTIIVQKKPETERTEKRIQISS